MAGAAHSYSGWRIRERFRRRFGPDAIEQPFESLDFTYFWYPTDRFTVKAKAQNILGDTIEITRSEPGRKITVFEEDPGTTFSVAFSWEF